MIKEVRARQVLDSRGNPTVEAELSIGNYSGRAIVPSGASTGKYEALELKDNNKRIYLGKSVLKAVENINKTISKNIAGKEFTQNELDNFLIKLDGTENKSKLGANAILAVSMAFAKAKSAEMNIPLHVYLGNLTNNKKYSIPIPFCNVINGGKHAGNKIKFQEFMIVPLKFRKFSDAIKAVSETYHLLKEIVKSKYGETAVNVGDEGGFAPDLSNPEEAFILLEMAIKQAGYKGKIKIAMDSAASEFFSNGFYELEKKYYSNELLDYYLNLIKNYPLISIEDPFEQDDFDGFKNLMEKTRGKIQIVGDDLLVTNKSRIKAAIEHKLCNALLLKVNQIGTLTEALEAGKLAMDNKWKVMVSHRSGDTEDTFIADLAVGLGCGQIKTGATCRSERVSKYNQLLRIEEQFKNIKYG